MAWWFFDIETEEWDTLVHAAAHCDDGRFVHMQTPDDVKAWYTDLPASDIVWSHNGGGYDFLLLIDVCRDETWSARMAGSSIVSCRAKGRAECRDSMRLFPGSLAQWTERKEELGLPCRCGSDCGGYCSIRRGMSRAERARLVEYNDSDCIAGLSRIRSDIQRLQSEGLDIIGHRELPRLTFGSVAWATASRMGNIDVEDAPQWAAYDDGRRAYYGGRCEVGRTTSTIGHRYDVNAMYPWALTHPVPCGRRVTMWGEAARKAYRDGEHGAYLARVDIPETDIPHLPHRYQEAKNCGRLTRDRLVWATGTMSGWWTLIELEAAEGHGTRILDVECAVIWEWMEPLYEPYVRFVYDLRDRARSAGDKRWAGILKWYANALSGKLAQRPIASSTMVLSDRDPEPLGWFHAGGRVWTKPSRRLSANSRPIEAAYLTSRARIKLLDRLIRHSGHWLYCDTDSTYLTRPDSRDVDQTRLGAFQYEGEARDWRALAPKLYRYRDGEREHVRARGVPQPTWETIDELAANNTIARTRGVHRLKSAGGEFKRRTITKRHRDAVTNRCGTRFVLPDGRTRPLHRTRDGRYV